MSETDSPMLEELPDDLPEKEEEDAATSGEAESATTNGIKRKLSVGAYEPTVEEHIGGSVDDESSIQYDEDERNSDEIDTLKKESEVPLTDIMAMYGYSHKNMHLNIKFKEDSQDESGSEFDGNELYQRVHLYDKDDWKKEILIGADYQAEIPSLIEKEDEAASHTRDTLLWCPDRINSKDVEEYLLKIYSDEEFPVADVNRDDEEALYNLHRHGYKVETALLEKQSEVDGTKAMKPWSEKECQGFENGLKIYGKQFNLIQKNLVTSRSVSEIIQFYYLWKKTERYDIFIQYTRLGTKRYIFNPGQPLDMDRYICNSTHQHSTDTASQDSDQQDTSSLMCP